MLVLSYLPLFTSAPANFSLSQESADDLVKAVQTSSDLAVGKGIMWIETYMYLLGCSFIFICVL